MLITVLIKAANLIKKFEGLKNQVYLCPAGHLSIGYGHRVRWYELWNQATGAVVDARELKGVEVKNSARYRPLEKVTLSEEAAEALLYKDLSSGNYLKSDLPAEVLNRLNVNQQAALLSFCYNTGSLSENMKKRLEREHYDLVASAMLRYTKCGGKELAGLKARRQEEVELFNTPL